MENSDNYENKIKDFFNLKDIWNYILGKRKGKSKNDINTKMMHWMNRFAIIVFLAAILIWIIKRLV